MSNQHSLFASEDLRLANDCGVLLQEFLHTGLLVDNTSVADESHSFASPELHKYVRVRDKKHLLDLMQLLVAHNADLARAGRWFHNEAELLVVALALSNHIGGQWHALNALD